MFTTNFRNLSAITPPMNAVCISRGKPRWKQIGGKTVKSSDGVYYSLRRNFGTAVTLDVTIQHQFLCERVKVGEKVIPAKPETVVPAQPERVEEVYEWKCPPSVLAGE